MASNPLSLNWGEIVGELVCAQTQMERMNLVLESLVRAVEARTIEPNQVPRVETAIIAKFYK